MEFIELTHRVTGPNAGGVEIDTYVVARDGRKWSIEEAGRLIFAKQAQFFFDGEIVTELSVLPKVDR